jgi:hypothetical protein
LRFKVMLASPADPCHVLRMLCFRSPHALATRSKQDKPAHFKPQQAKKVMILGLLALVGNAPNAVLPAEIAAGLPQLLSGLVRLLMDLKAQQDRAAEAEDEEEEPDEEVSRYFTCYNCCYSVSGVGDCVWCGC